MKEKFGAKDPKSCHLRFHVQTSGESLTAQQVDNNIVRVSLQALAAALGGCQSLHTNSRDEALALPTEESVKIALRTQQIIANETGITKTVDPLGGSYYVEELTTTIEDSVQEYLRRIESMGGALAAVERGYFQDEIRQNSYRLKKEIDQNERIIVGVNKFQDSKDREPQLNLINPEAEKKQLSRLKEFKMSRDQSKVDSTLSELLKAAESDNENLMPYIIESVKCHSTLGEISAVFMQVFGAYLPKISF
jgi:methylmalonyl-CoA mutase N-terminal domain/subunit